MYDTYLNPCSDPDYFPFITRKKSQLYEGSEPFRFITFNTPNLHYLEDRPPQRTFPTAYEQSDALRTIAQLGGRITRTYTFAIAPLGDTHNYAHIARFPDPTIPKENPGGPWIAIPNSENLYANEELFKVLDSALAIARSYKVRLIIPFIDRWHWWGGIETFAGLFGKSGTEFYTDRLVRSQFLAVVAYIINRSNTINGVCYKNDPTIAIFETGNELITMDYNRVHSDWTIEVARFIKSMDPNHLVMDGSYGYYGWEDAVLNDPNIDVFSNHYYQIDPPSDPCVQPKPDLSDWTYAGRVQNEARFLQSRGKAFLVGEAGLAPVDWMVELMKRVIVEMGVSGLLVWSLRFRSRDGGFCKFPHLSSGAKVIQSVEMRFRCFTAF
jgi:hypothetical protein